jgi:hypothetical protein
MKLVHKPAISKIVARVDNELMEIIMADLRAMKNARSRFLRLIKTEQLSVA